MKTMNRGLAGCMLLAAGLLGGCSHFHRAAEEQPKPTGATFEQALEFQGIRFRVTATAEGTGNVVRVEPAGLEIDNSAMERTLEGRVTGAEAADLNVDGSPEIYVYVAGPDKLAKGALVAYSANKRKSLSEIYLPPLEEDAVNSEGYRGQDEFAVLEGVLGRRFPIYKAGDADRKPSGGMRQLQYKLSAGEAGWLLVLDRVSEF